MFESQIVTGLFASAFATMTAAALTPIVRALADALGAVDAPGERRMHARAIPRMGGLAIVGGFAAAFLLSVALELVPLGPTTDERLMGFGAGAFVIVVAGVFDDIRGLGAKRKLLAQLLAATIAWYGGARVQPVLNVPGLGMVEVGIVASYFATIVWVLAFTNAINLIDGLDGLAGGVVFFAALTNVVVAFITDNPLAAAVNGALAGAVLGFLFYNFNPAKIFMGDTGSLFLGYALSAGALLSSRQKESTLASLLVPLVALGVPLTDTILAMLRRVVARRSIFAADREHLHHKLVDAGLTHRRAVIILYGFSITLCGISIAVAFGQNWQVGAALLGALLVIAGMLRVAGAFDQSIRQRAQREARYGAATEAVRQMLPAFVRLAARVPDRQAVLELLEQHLDSRYFNAASLTTGAGEALWTWSAPATSGRREGQVKHCTFELRSSSADAPDRLKFACWIEAVQIPPQLDVLLRVVGDVIESTPSVVESGIISTNDEERTSLVG